jgi:hypothetical protein
MALSSGSKKSTQSDSDSDSDDEVRDELPFLREENERLRLLLDNRDDMLREAKKMRKELRALLAVDYRIKVHMDLQAGKSPVVVKGPFFPRLVNPRYRIRGRMCNARFQSSKSRKDIL